jgi:PAS domain S-box-containing protein
MTRPSVITDALKSVFSYALPDIVIRVVSEGSGAWTRGHYNKMDTLKLGKAITVPSRSWLGFSSQATLIVAIAFFLASLCLNSYSSGLSGAFILSILIALTLAISLTSYSLTNSWSKHRTVEQAFHDADCEFSSIFQNVLDGILIVDDKGGCLDANPASAAILRVSIDKLIGQNIVRFLADSSAFMQSWSLFLRTKTQRGRAQLIAGDGTLLFVDFTAAANYLPGRHVLILCDVTERTKAEMSLQRSEERFRHMANNIQEIFWMMDAETQEITYINPAYATITGHSVQSLQENPFSYQELIHAEDRIRVLSRLQDLRDLGILDEEFRFIRADGEVRWAWAKGVPVSADGGTRWLVGTVQDITSRKQAETGIFEQLEAVETARAEAEALRKATLALSQNLAMDSVLDTLLHCISELVPFDKATVLFAEDGANLMIAREAPRNVSKRMGLTLNAAESIFLQRILFEKQSILLIDVAKHCEWREIQPLDGAHSWLGVPLIAGGHVLGILSLGAKAPSVFTPEHLRLSKSLAIPAAVAIQNARTHERAEIYAAELELRLKEQFGTTVRRLDQEFGT